MGIQCTLQPLDKVGRVSTEDRMVLLLKDLKKVVVRYNTLCDIVDTTGRPTQYARALDKKKELGAQLKKARSILNDLTF